MNTDPNAGPLWAPELPAPAERGMCTDCGVSRMESANRCIKVCQFSKPSFPALETRVHGRAREPERPDELFFGPFKSMLRATLKMPLAGAQNSGIATRIAERLLETGAVQAVLTVAPDPRNRWKPVPVLVTRAGGMAHCRGLRMGFAPVLALLEPARAAGYTRIAIIGVPCQVHALRGIEAEMGFERIYVIGTACADNTTAEKFHGLLTLLAEDPALVTYVAFRPDARVEIRFVDGSRKVIPLPSVRLDRLPRDFIPTTCRTCVDFTNVLADITIGFTAGDGEQWLIVRNDRGEELLGVLGGEITTGALRDSGQRGGRVRRFIKSVERVLAGRPSRPIGALLRPILAWLAPRTGPRGLEYARARVEMKAIETVLLLRARQPGRMRRMVPAHIWALVAQYGITEQVTADVSKPAKQRRQRRRR